jgi:hypothetical protein
MWDLTRKYPAAYASWKYAVNNGGTLRGFAEWIIAESPVATEVQDAREALEGDEPHI